MKIDKSLMTGSTGMLILKLLSGGDMYGYQMIEELALRSEHAFELKTGTLYPLLHGLEEQGCVSSYEREEGGRPRRYYHLEQKGKQFLSEKRKEWESFTRAVDLVMEGGANFATA